MSLTQPRRADGCHYIASVWRNLRHESESLHRRVGAPDAGILKGTPPNDILTADAHRFLDRNQRVQTLVILRSVDVDSHRLSITRERVAVGAGVDVLHHGAALRLAEVPQLPLDQRNGRGRQRLDLPVLRS